MSKRLIIMMAVIVILAAVAFAVSSKKSYAPTNNNERQSTASENRPATDTAQTAATGTSFTVNANDDGADLTTLNVKKGDKVSVTFQGMNNGMYYGGIEFRSDVVSTGTIKGGESETVTFTADKSFDFVPYWPASNIKKDYVVAVKVQ